MERYMKLIRWLLEHAEQKDSGRYTDPPQCRKYTMEQMHYHIGLCSQADYLTVEEISAGEERFKRYAIGSLTWKGHEALKEIRKS